ncbi:MAG: hypothetical protein LBQ50_14215, partial [Planctomycetaceae bacterium]|nr:hypothetical protein [Planctomycetaceae bacterium]
MKPFIKIIKIIKIIKTILLSGWIVVLLFISRFVFAETPEPVVLPTAESVAEPVPTATLIPPKSERQEPYRVFFPVDRFQKIVGNTVYIPMEFLQLLSRNVKIAGPEPLWNIERAEYHGSLVRNPLTQDIELADDFKVIFEINLDTENVAMTFPLLPLFQDRVFWDSKPIQAIRRTAANQEGGSLIFNIENEKKGKHRLEISLAPKQEEHDKTRRISFTIPKVPNAVLRLKTPQDAPAINVAECLGAVTPNSMMSPNLVAEIGASDKLVFSWSNELNRGVLTTADAEQFFWLWAKPTQVEIRAFFRFRIEGGRVPSLHLQTDPRWHRSGPFHCEEYPIEQMETYLDLTNPDEMPLSQNEVTRLDFKTPVSGILTVSAGFVLRDFNGVGKIRLPQFRALQSRITKSMLAVSAEPVMELDCPNFGLGTGFETGFPGSVGKEHPLAEYDLTKTDSSWLLAIRTKNQTPTVKWSQSVCFNDGDSGLLCSGEFSAVREVFLQRFSTPGFFRLESVEVRDSRQNPVEVRVTETTSESNKEKRTHWIIFLKRAVSGNYSITVRGNFATEISKSGQTGQPVPLVLFDGVRTEEKLLNVFRTSAVVAEIRTEETDWVVSEIAPVAPNIFQDSFPLRSWKWKESPSAPENNRTAPPQPVDWTIRVPTFSLVPNKPIIRGEQIITVSRSTTDVWNVLFDVLWDISNGELETVRFRWDEQCGSTISIEPAVPFTLEQSDGHSHLILSQKIPFSGQQHFRIKATLNTTGTSISIPKLVPELNKAEKVETKTYVILPRYADEEVIPWDLNRLETVDDVTQKLLEEKTAKPLEENKVPISGSAFPVSEGMTAGQVRSIIVQEPESRLFLRATGNGTDDFTATITRKNSPSVVSLYDMNFFIKDNGTLFGCVTIDLKSRGQDNFILRMPPDYELIRVTCSGIASKGMRLSEDRWKIDLWSSDYPQRIRIVFHGVLSSSAGKSEPFSLSRFNQERGTTSLYFPVLEGVTVQQTLWTVSFESYRDRLFPPFDLTLFHASKSGVPAFSASRNGFDAAVSLGQHPLISGNQAMQTLLQINLIRLNNLLLVLSSVSAPAPARFEEVKRWFTHWSDEWFSAVNTVEYQTKNFPSTLQSGGHNFLLDPAIPAESASGFIGTILESKNLPVLIEALMQRYQSDVSSKFLSTATVSERQHRQPQLFFSNSPLPWRDRTIEDASYFFGVNEEPLSEIRLTTNPEGYHLPFFLRYRSLNHLLLGLAIPVLLLILSIRFHVLDLFFQFPHFCGIVLGLLLWSLF